MNYYNYYNFSVEFKVKFKCHMSDVYKCTSFEQRNLTIQSHGPHDLQTILAKFGKIRAEIDHKVYLINIVKKKAMERSDYRLGTN